MTRHDAMMYGNIDASKGLPMQIPASYSKGLAKAYKQGYALWFKWQEEDQVGKKRKVRKNPNATPGQPIEVGRLQRGDLFRWHPSALEPGEDPSNIYVVYEVGKYGGVQVIRLETGLAFPVINTVGRHWLTIPTGQRATREIYEATKNPASPIDLAIWGLWGWKVFAANPKPSSYRNEIRKMEQTARRETKRSGFVHVVVEKATPTEREARVIDLREYEPAYHGEIIYTPHRLQSNPREDDRIRLAKKWGKANGFKGTWGGWIYSPAGRPVAHGWLDFFFKFQSRIMGWK